MDEPLKVDLRADAVFIDWKDGHKSRYPGFYLRTNCNCAACVDEMSGRRRLDPRTVPDDVQAAAYLEVGRYAYGFLFSDMHDTGIYPFERLRELCPCAECKGKRT
ncbi:MAG: DUF971 domain-containing protein [Dehalococcoidia bacterium]|nr:DUF971 domain-containing protein [Dehalococcoidia bacterium]